LRERNSYNLIKSRGVVPANLKARITENISCVIGATPNNFNERSALGVVALGCLDIWIIKTPIN